MVIKLSCSSHSHTRTHTRYTHQGGVTLAHAVGRFATAVKVLTGENFTLTLDLQRLSSLTCDLDVSCRSFDLHLFLYAPALVT